MKKDIPLRNKVRGWMELNSLDPLKPLPTAERILNALPRRTAIARV